MVAEGNVGVAFALVSGAGLATSVGACSAFFASMAKPRLLAAGLGVSAGVMVFVSFSEIYMRKSTGAFEDAQRSTNASYRFATFCFFGGIFLTWCLDRFVHVIADYAVRRNHTAAQAVHNTASLVPECEPDSAEGVVETSATSAAPQPAGDSAKDAELGLSTKSDAHHYHDPNQFALKRMGVLTAAAIFIHNFPEGLATFVGALSSTSSGVAIAVAIALHNIPEGICVAMPIYFATGSKKKAFLWATLSGISEPFGGLLGFLILSETTTSTNITYGIVFGLVAGIMVYISIKELIPMALRYDKEDTVVTPCFFLGMLIMAVSLLLFTI
ncbi:hypothetical protein WJX72_005404 [[Myrmecia] bisecta]|uniref:Zinc transporter n=1 Tax=[Myrmecia] bisecta TaxID=41462 RepID=A0AAW1PLI1_9CHLO